MGLHRITGAVALVLALSAGGAADGHSPATGGAPANGRSPAGLPAGERIVRLGPIGRAVPPSFVGISVETNELRSFEHRVAAFARFLSLLRVPGQGPVSLRVGGESADNSYFTGGGFRAPPGQMSIDGNWVPGLAALVKAAHLSVILDLNTAAHSPKMAAVLADAVRRALPFGSLQAFEIGNEPDLYHDGLIGFKHYRHGWPAQVAWAASYAPQDYVRQFNFYGKALGRVAPRVPLAGPADAGWGDTWDAWLIAHARTAPGMITTHRYPLAKCAPLTSFRFPTVASVLSDYSSGAVSRSLRSDVAVASAAGLGVRVTELGLAACGGVHGATDALAAALWAPDVLFGLMHSGVDGVNIHARFGYPNSPIQGNVAQPAQAIFYGMLAVTRMLGPGARVQDLAISGPANPELSVWAVRLPHSQLRLIAENKGPVPATVSLDLGGRDPATVQWLSGPAPDSTAVTLAGQKLDSTGRWRGTLRMGTLRPRSGAYRLTLQGYRAALVFATVPH